MKKAHLQWLTAGIGALLLMSSFTVYVILRDGQTIENTFEAYQWQVDSLERVRQQELQQLQAKLPELDSALTRFRDLEAPGKARRDHTLQHTRDLIRTSDRRKLLWTSLMGVAGLIGLAILRAGKKNTSS